ncbi:MAG: hypothetical protein AB1752_08320 [Candidatus Zixiibacteriota bacterium]
MTMVPRLARTVAFGAFVVALCLQLTGLAFGQGHAPNVNEIDVPTPPTPPHAVVKVVDSLLAEFTRDSIFATEITIDASGVSITDRNGRTIRLDERHFESIPPGPGFPVDEFDTYSGEPSVVHVFADVITIEPGEIVDGDVVCIFGGHIEVLGRVRGSVVSIFGTINVEGTVDHQAVAPLGVVRVGPNGSVGRDVVASQIDKEPGGRIGGMRNELFFNLFGEDWANRSPYWGQAALTVLVSFKILFVVFLVLLAHALAARNVARVKSKIQVSFFKSFFIGVLAQILSLPLILLLIVTIIGIPVALFLLPLMFVAAIVLSLAAFGLWVGELINENTALQLPSALSRTLLGLLTLQSVWLIPIIALWGSRIGSVGESLKVLSLVSIGIAIVMSYVIVTTGSGAVLLTRFGTRPKEPVPTKPESPEPEAALPPDVGTRPNPLPSRPADEPGAAHAAG